MYFGRKVLVVQRNVLPLSCKTTTFTTTIVQISNITLGFIILIFWWDQTLVTGSQINRPPCITSDITHYLFHISSFNNHLIHNISKCDWPFQNKHNQCNAEEILNLCSELCYEAMVPRIFTESKNIVHMECVLPT